MKRSHDSSYLKVKLARWRICLQGTLQEKNENVQSIVFLLKLYNKELEFIQSTHKVLRNTHTACPSIGAGCVLVLTPVTGGGVQVTRNPQVIIQVSQVVTLEIVLVKAVSAGICTQRETLQRQYLSCTPKPLGIKHST